MATSGDPVVLNCGNSSLQVYPDMGASFGAWTWCGRDILRAAVAPGSAEESGCFPLVPYANRIGGAFLPGTGQLLPHPGEPHSLHGTGWADGWRVIHCDGQNARLELAHCADARWPFPFTAELVVMLSADMLAQTLTVRNDGERPMPAGLGFHPFFPIDGDTVLKARWKGVWISDAALLPISHAASPGPPATPVLGWTINNCFTSWDGLAVLEYGSHAVTIEADPACRYLHCYHPGAASPWVAIEPVSHIPNAHQLAQQGVPDTGLRTLAAGEAMSATMTLRAVPRQASSTAPPPSKA